jgi:amino acid adenylation domain-containing protein
MSDSPVAYDPFRSGEIVRTVPSTEPQREIVSSALLGDTANIAFNEGISVRFPYRVDADRLSNALSEIVSRHESLRTTFTRTGDELCVSAAEPFEVRVDDQSALDSNDAEHYVQQFWERAAAAPMNLFEGPLFEATLIRLPGDSAELVIMAHHVVCDGWSFYIILEELAALLSGESLTTLPDSFADFAERENAEQLSNKDLDYWLAQYADSVPELDLPSDRPRPAERSFAARRTDFVLDAEATASVTSLARECKASIVQVTFAGVAALLHRLTDDEDIAIGLPVARQSTDGLNNLLGHAVQLLPIRLLTSPVDTFRELVTKSRSGILDAQEHPNFTFGTLIRETGYSGDASRVPIVPVIFNIDQAFGELRAEGQVLSVRSVPRLGENFEIFFNVMPTGDELRIEATYNTDLFDEATILDWLAALRHILTSAEQDPDLALGEVWRDAGAAERDTALTGPASDLENATWIASFERHVAEDGRRTAVVDQSAQYSRQELLEEAQAIAGALMDAGVEPGDVVAHCIVRSASLPVVMLGIQLAGAVMLPLDPEFPADRIAFMLADSHASLVVSESNVPEALAETGATILPLKDALAGGSQRVLPELEADSPCYLIYTSGSTGKPKGVLVSHDALLNFLHSMARKPGFDEASRLLAVTTASFDISLLELLLPLYTGGSVYVASREEATDARALKEIIEQQDISVLQATPATWRMLLAAQWQGAPGLKALCGGEAMPADLAQRLLPLVGELWNMYGPTETTIWSSCKRIEPGFELITVGAPIQNTSFVVLDGERNAVPRNVPGELCIGGRGLAIEYLGLDSLTADRFIEVPQHGRLYRTGDRARTLASGEIQFLGRFDDQVKVRGFRIELGDIETVLRQFPAIEAAAAYVWQLSDSDQRIVACCVIATGQQLQAHRLRKFLRKQLPDYMIPQHFLEIDTIPLSPSGKVNRRALPRPAEVQSKIGTHTPPQNAAEKAIAEIWTTLIKPDRPIGREARFFEIGGHSLLGLEAVYRIEQRLSVRLHPRILFIEDLAGVARQCDASETVDEALRPERLAKDVEPLLSFGQLEIAERIRQQPDATTFNLPACFRLTGRLEVDRLRLSLAAVFRRHTALLTLIDERPGGEPRPEYSGNACLPELSVVDNFSGDESDAVAYVAELSRASVDLARGPLAQLALLTSAAQVHYLCFVPHQFAFDGWSFDVFLRDLEAAYLNGGSLPEPGADALQYVDYSTWQRNQPVDQSTASYWREQLPLLDDLPPWRRGDEVTESTVAAAGFTMPLDTVEKLEAELAKSKSKLPDVCLAVFVATLGASAGVKAVSLDLATSGRYLPELFSIVGLFYQDLPVTISADRDVRVTLKNTESAIGALAQYQNVARARVESELGETLLRPAVSFSFQQATERPTHFGDLAFAQVDVPRSSIARDLDFWIRRTPVSLVAQLDYRADSIDAAAADLLAASLHESLESIARGGSVSLVSPVPGLFETATAKVPGLLSKLFS